MWSLCPEGYGAILFNLICELDVWVDGVEVGVEFFYIPSVYACVAVVHISEPPIRGGGGGGLGAVACERLLFNILHDQTRQDSANK